ncbi:hypothetical protein [Geobacter grbiciae]|uniref:hypothetical protein n=1 Tax=Geobacter grbiciae TaxID=155042 RepID=UPI001C0380CA|nr:hypothetical protein [Geobacter grbiciae]MBT1074251.1 hypothetical protein [Geobacter grbiciae]
MRQEMNRNISRAGLLMLGFLLAGCASFGTQPTIRADVVMKTDGIIHLQHKGSGDPGKLYCVGETVPVYRWYAGGRYAKYREVGKARIIKLPEGAYLDAAIVEGDIKEGDVMRKSQVCLKNEP